MSRPLVQYIGRQGDVDSLYPLITDPAIETLVHVLAREVRGHIVASCSPEHRSVTVRRGPAHGRGEAVVTVSAVFSANAAPPGIAAWRVVAP